MTDNEIIRACEICRERAICYGCAYADDVDCVRKRETDAIDLMKMQQARIKRLQKARAETVKEFAERIHEEILAARNINFRAIQERTEKHNVNRYEDTFCYYCDGKIHALDGIQYFIDELLKEFIGDQK